VTITGLEGTALIRLEGYTTTMVGSRKIGKLVGRERVFIADQDRLFYGDHGHCFVGLG